MGFGGFWVMVCSVVLVGWPLWVASRRWWMVRVVSATCRAWWLGWLPSMAASMFLNMGSSGERRCLGVCGGWLVPCCVDFRVLDSGYPNNFFSRLAFSFLSVWRQEENFWRFSV